VRSSIWFTPDVPNGLRTSLRRLGAFQAIIVMPAPPHWHQFSAVQRDTHGQGLRNAFCSVDEKRSCFRRALHARRVAEERQPARPWARETHEQNAFQSLADRQESLSMTSPSMQRATQPPVIHCGSSEMPTS